MKRDVVKTNYFIEKEVRVQKESIRVRDEKRAITEDNERESSSQRKSKVSLLPPFSLLAIRRIWRSANFSAIPRSRARVPESPSIRSTSSSSGWKAIETCAGGCDRPGHNGRKRNRGRRNYLLSRHVNCRMRRSQPTGLLHSSRKRLALSSREL